MKILIKIIIIAWSSLLIGYAQFNPNNKNNSGRIIGKVIDAETGESLSKANVIVINSNKGTETNIEGIYVIEEIPQGLYSLKATYFRYNSQVQINVKVFAYTTTQVCFALVKTDPDDSVAWINRANRDIVNKDAKILHAGLQVRNYVISDSEEATVTRKYGFTYKDMDCSPNKGYSIYNEIVNRYLDKLNGEGWHQRLEHDLGPLKKKVIVLPNKRLKLTE
jgi:hypothetical protein